MEPIDLSPVKAHIPNLVVAHIGSKMLIGTLKEAVGLRLTLSGVLALDARFTPQGTQIVLLPLVPASRPVGELKVHSSFYLPVEDPNLANLYAAHVRPSSLVVPL